MTTIHDLDRPQATDVVAPTETRHPEEFVATRSAATRLPASWALLGISAWVFGMTIATAIEPAAPDVTPPFLVDQAVTIASYGLLATLIGFAMRRRFALGASALTASFLLATTSWCVVHLGVGPVLLTQVAIVTSILVGSLAALLRR